jgi:radical SAM superfamily enzyme YgiQ (UPF0313 family)
MQNKSILFIEPAGSSANVFDNYMKLPLMGTLYLGTILHNKGYRVKILNENILSERIDPFEIEADYFCISALTLSANRTKLLAKQLKQLYPQSKVIIGGIHATLLPEEFIEYADHVIVGEAEGNIVDIIEGRYPDQIVHGKPIDDLNHLPLVNYGLMERIEKMGHIPIMTSRGCPFNCNFCTVTKIFGRKYRKQAPARIMEEIKNALKYFKTNEIFFYDDNLTADRKRADELFDSIIDQRLSLSWSAQVRSDLGKFPELIAKMRKAGCNRLFIGFESIDDHTLEALHKSQTRRDIENAITVIHDQGINIHGMFMLGEDNDTLGNINKPFPGTKIYKQLKAEKRIYHENWDNYDGMYIVYRPKNINPLKLQMACITGYKRFYSLRRTAIDATLFFYNIFLDALVLNFNKLFKYDLHTVFVKLGAKLIIYKWMQINKSYLTFLENIESRV